MTCASGIRPSYPARDNDPRLTEYAQTAAPFISAIEAYLTEHGKLPDTFEQIRPHLPPAYATMKNPTDSLWNGWWYERNESHYSLKRSLGWDPFLVYASDTESWSFDPGDGSPVKSIKLEIRQED